MKRYSVLAVVCLVALFSGAVVFAQQSGGFTGPTVPRATAAQTVYQAVTVSQLQTLPNSKSWVTLTGNITQSVGRKSYTFRDATGEINVEIDSQYWWGLTVAPTDRVQVLVSVEKKRNGRIEAEVKGIRKQ